jgi:ribosome biogenesis protein MAK21
MEVDFKASALFASFFPSEYFANPRSIIKSKEPKILQIMAMELATRAKQKDNRKRRRGRTKPSDETNGSNPSKLQKRAASPTFTNKTPTARPPKQQQPRATPLITLEDGQLWYQYMSSSSERNALIDKNSTNSASVVQTYRNLADELYRNERMSHADENGQEDTDALNSRKKDERWMESTMKHGTWKDKIAAMSLTLSSDPIRKLHVLDSLMAMINTNSRIAGMAAEAMEDLFVNYLIPNSRKLYTLSQRPLYLYENNPKKTLSPKILLLWRVEELIKEKYDTFLKTYIARTLSSPLSLSSSQHANNNNKSNNHHSDAGVMETHTKIRTLKIAAHLFACLPENESFLLTVLTNKLGDPHKKVAAAAGHELRGVLQQHPAMKQVLAREVQQFVHRPNLSDTGLYNAVIFLNQIPLHSDTDQDLAQSLIRTYFRLFEVFLAKADKDQKQRHSNKATTSSKGEDRSMRKSRLLSALLTGVNRARPYQKRSNNNKKDGLLSESQHVDALHRIVHTAPPGSQTQALVLLLHAGEESTPSDRFYRALYATVADPSTFTGKHHLTLFFNVLYKAMKADTDTSRIGAFAKRLLATTLHCPSPIVAGSLFLLEQVARTEHSFLKSCYTDVFSLPDGLRILDASKREPRGALVVMEHFSPADHDENEKEKRAPGWEISLLSQHYHPSVKKFAENVSADDNESEVNQYSGDPLKDFSIMAFLDKFAYRNPKKLSENHSRKSIAQRRRHGNVQSVPMNDPEFLEKDNVNVQDQFFRQFFVERAKRDTMKGIVRNTKSSDNQDDNAVIDQEEAKFQPKSFGEYEEQWETDDEEEAFVDQLAEGIMEDEVDIDDEGPDLDDQDDASDTADDEIADELPARENFTVDSDGEDEDDDDVDAYMDKASDSEGSEEFEEEGDEFMRDEDSEDEGMV